MSARVSRNDPCPCGSKKKYKNCHGKKGLHLNIAVAKKIFLVLIILAAMAWAGKEYIFAARDTEVSSIPVPGQQSKRVQPLVPQPPGPVPPGKVWSPEHGHWHDVAPNSSDSSSAYHPKPSGPNPPGKVWSYEHGHWHDSSGTSTGNFTPGPPPPGPAPAGKVWSYEHGHWHDAPKNQPTVDHSLSLEELTSPQKPAGSDAGQKATKTDGKNVIQVDAAEARLKKVEKKPAESATPEDVEGVEIRPKGTVIQ